MVGAAPSAYAILYQNNDILAVDKPALLPSQRTVDSKRLNLEQLVQEQFPQARLAHRIDSETSGIVLFSLSEFGRKTLDQLFKNHQIKKVYTALALDIRGSANKDLALGLWKDYLELTRVRWQSRQRDKMQVVVKGGELALAELLSIKSEDKNLLGFPVVQILIQLKSGRRHQIRVQASSRGFPLLGDIFYSSFEANLVQEKIHQQFHRHFLHATTISFPEELAWPDIKSPLPSEFEMALQMDWKQRNATNNTFSTPTVSVIALNKPYNVLSQFTLEDNSKDHTQALAQFSLPKDFWPVGRLDRDSEGLLLLTNDKSWRHRMMTPESEKEKVYWAMVEGHPEPEFFQKLRKGVTYKESGKNIKLSGVKARLLSLDEIASIADLVEFPLEFKENQNPNLTLGQSKIYPTIWRKKGMVWVELILTEGKNRQVRKMTAQLGHPTVRLIRVGFGQWRNSDVKPGQWRYLNREDLCQIEKSNS